MTEKKLQKTDGRDWLTLNDKFNKTEYLEMSNAAVAEWYETHDRIIYEIPKSFFRNVEGAVPLNWKVIVKNRATRKRKGLMG